MNSSATEQGFKFLSSSSIQRNKERRAADFSAALHILELTSVETRDSGFFAGKPKGLEIKLEAYA